MTEWAKLSPPQRAEARLHYLQAAKLDMQLKRDRWEAYNRRDSAPPSPPHAADEMEVVPPVSVNVRPGATTVLMPKLLEDAPLHASQ